MQQWRWRAAVLAFVLSIGVTVSVWAFQLSGPPSQPRVDELMPDLQQECGPEVLEATIAKHSPGDYPLLSLRSGTAIPDFGFLQLDGKLSRLSELTGRYVLLELWATWCRPCRAQLPVVQRVYQDFHGRGVDVLGINVDEKPEKAREFVQANGITWPQTEFGSVQDLIERHFAVRVFPTAILLDEKRRVVEIDPGVSSRMRSRPHSLSGEKLYSYIAELVQQQ